MFVKRAKLFDWSVGVRGWLKIRHEVVTIITTFQPAYSVVDLFEHILARNSAARTKTPIVAEVTTTGGDCSVDVWTRKARINAHFLHTMPKSLAQKIIIGKIMESPMPPVMFGGFNRYWVAGVLS